jgi:cation diffusion facilitator CzcD-associated flavoprotein CzcO
MISSSSKQVVIIGAGASGLCLAKELLQHPSAFKVIVLEAGSQLGGTWVYESHRSSLYKSLRTNLPRECMAFPKFNFDKVYHDGRQFPGHAEVQEYM